MSTPMCPVHNSPMRAGKKAGTFFCPRADSSKANGYCDQRSSGAPAYAAPTYAAPAPAPVTAGPVAMPAAVSGERLAMRLAALAFAGAVYHGTGAEEAALALANETLLRWDTQS